jgi:(p)ppGpp synthase/HD superfamily hydrolase
MEDKDNWEEAFEACIYSDKLVNFLYSINNMVDDTLDINQIRKAIYYAKKYHGKQLRKSGEPYYMHPIEVAYIFAEYAYTENLKYYSTDLIVTAILHDTIEDTELTKSMIAELFNENIAENVEGLTRIKFDKKISAGETLNLLFRQHKKDILYIKLFDRLHNIRTIQYMKPQKIVKIIDETMSYFLPLSANLRTYKTSKELIETCTRVAKKIFDGANIL